MHSAPLAISHDTTKELPLQDVASTYRDMKAVENSQEELTLPKHICNCAWEASELANNMSKDAELDANKHNDAQAAHFHASELHGLTADMLGSEHPQYDAHAVAEELHSNKWESHRALVHGMEESFIEENKYKSKTGGLTRAGVNKYNKENPGHHLKMAVTTAPSKLDPKGKAAGRRRSFCARMGGVKGPMKDEHGKPTRKALALRKWNCN